MEEEKEEAQNPKEEEHVDTAEPAKTEETPEEPVKEETAEEEVTAEPEEKTEVEAEKEEGKTPAEEEKAEAPARGKKEEEEEIVEERIYTVPLGKAWIMPPRKRAPRAMRMLRSFMIKHMKLEARRKEEGEEEEEPKNLIISNEVNERIWARGIEKPPRKIRVKAAVDKDGNVTVYMAEGD